MSELPFTPIMLKAAREQARRLTELEAENTRLTSENTRLRVTIANLRRRIYQARHVHANWLLRQQAWRAERDDLLRRLSLTTPTPTPSQVALIRWGPEK